MATIDGAITLANSEILYVVEIDGSVLKLFCLKSGSGGMFVAW
jgi:hypothetical protein